MDFQKPRAGKNVLLLVKTFYYFFESDILNPAYCLTHSSPSFSLFEPRKRKRNMTEMFQVMDFQKNNCGMVNSRVKVGDLVPCLEHNFLKGSC